MSLPAELLAQARFLVTREPKRPREASLRRAVSAAYYSLFHLLAEDAARVMFGGADARALRSIARRAFQHGTMKKVAKGIAAGNPSEAWQPVLAAPSAELKFVANTFVELQDERHQADYDPARQLTRAEAMDLVQSAETATKAWTSIRRTSPGSESYSLEARIFLAALLLGDQVSRR